MMAIPSIPEAKKRERMRLSNLFERLAARLPQTTISSDANKDATSGKSQTPPMPDEFSNVLRKPRRSDASEEEFSQTRRSTVTSTSSMNIGSRRSGNVASSQENDDEGYLSEFPLAEELKYPFTFKHMIHKLYKKEDWLRTVKEVLEKSKKDFKPLAECDLRQNAWKCIHPDRTRATFMDVPLSRVGKRASSTMKGRELRRLSLAAGHGDETLRAVKKRCVGIRRSTSGNPSGGEEALNETKKSGKRGSFAFAATVSSMECQRQEIYQHFSSPQVSPSESCFSDTGQNTTTPDSPISPVTPTSPTSPICPYGIGYAAGMKRKVGINHPLVMLQSVPPSRLTERNLNRLSSRFSSETNEDLD